MSRKTDIAILGGGLAGLSLAYFLTTEQPEAEQAVNGPEDNSEKSPSHPSQNTGKKLSVTVIDDGAGKPDHMWGFWDGGEEWLAPVRDLVRKHYNSWSHWQIAGPSGGHVMQGRQYSYAAISANVFLKSLKQKCAESNVRFIPGSIKNVEKQNSICRIKLNNGDVLKAKEVFDTVGYRQPENIMLQHFHGWQIETRQNCFNPGQAMLMDFRVSQEAGIHFMYLLPFSEHHALVESTVFSREPQKTAWYEAQITTYLYNRYRLASGDYKTVSQEQGVLPMAPLTANVIENSLPMGLPAGAMRSSSSYAFSQILRQAHQLGRRRDDQPVIPLAGCDGVELWMDRVFLQVLDRHAELAPDIFAAMAQRMNGDYFARFMNGHAGWRPKLSVIRSVPTGPFIHEALGLKGANQKRA